MYLMSFLWQNILFLSDCIKHITHNLCTLIYQVFKKLIQENVFFTGPWKDMKPRGCCNILQKKWKHC